MIKPKYRQKPQPEPLAEELPITPAAEPVEGEEEPVRETSRASHRGGWGRSLWNALQANPSAFKPEAKSGHATRTSLDLTRRKTENLGSHSRVGSDGLPRALTRDDGSGSRLKARGKVAKLLNAFARGVQPRGVDANALTEEPAEEDATESSAEVMDRTAALQRPRWTRPTASLSSSVEHTGSANQRSPLFADRYVLQQHFGMLAETGSGFDVFGHRQQAGLHLPDMPAESKGSVSVRSVSGRSFLSEASAKGASAAPEKREAKSQLPEARQRDMVRFYSKHGALKDVALGEMLEELCLIASLNAAQTKKEAKLMTEKPLLQYYNDGRIVSFSVHAAPILEPSGKSSDETAEPTASEDVAAIAALMNADRDQARNVLLAAETAVNAVTGEPTAETTADPAGIMMWTVAAGSWQQTEPRRMTEVSGFGLGALVPSLTRLVYAYAVHVPLVFWSIRCGLDA